MDLSSLKSLLDIPILFFFFGMFAMFVRSNLEIPSPVAKSLSLYLLVAIGLKGGIALNESGINSTVLAVLLAAAIMSLAIPAYSFLILRRRINAFDAAALAATYGSVSAVTFIAASSFLTNAGVPFGGYMTVALVVMESPAIIMAIFLAKMARSQAPAVPEARSVGAAAAREARPPGELGFRRVIKEAFTDGAHILLLGSLLIGTISGPTGAAKLQPFVGALFPGILSFFLLDMGLLVGRRLRETKSIGPFLIGFGILMPVVNASAAAALGMAFGLDIGDVTLLAVLAASASYIVVPAVVRYAIPEANPSVYFTMALAVTFPFNIAVGIPLYYNGINWAWGAF